MDFKIKKIILPLCGSIAIFFSACAHSDLQNQNKENENRFEFLLRQNRLKEAIPFALYFSKNPQNTKQILLMTQYSLNSCQPQLAWQYIQKLNAGEEKDFLEAVLLTLVAVPRQWSKPILSFEDFSETAPEENKSVTTHIEPVQDEIWRDEWKYINTNAIVCKKFPIIQENELRQKQQEKAKAIFEKQLKSKNWKTIQLVGLAMDVGLIPEKERIHFYLNKFVANKSHPYFSRLVFLEQQEQEHRASLRSLQRKGNEFILSSFKLRSKEFEPKEIDLPWVVDIGSEQP